ncbi:MAG: glycosyltransferase family 2 protein [Myxococcota bacterium]
MTEFTFWSAAFLLLYTYFFYPLGLVLADAMARLWANARNVRALPNMKMQRTPPREEWPAVTVVVAAHNEAPVIREKIANTLALDYPKDKLQLIVGSDGSTDGTDEWVRAVKDERVVLSSAPRAGKTSVLNRCVPLATGQIIVLTDANTLLDAQAVKRLVRRFDDPEVGAVCGRLVLRHPGDPEYRESAYWAYESLLKLYEGARGAVMGANGGLYALRKSLFTALPPSTIVDDLVIPLKVVERGWRFVYEPLAVAAEETAASYDEEFGRRARIAAGNFQAVKLLRGLWWPPRSFAAFAFLSHKLIRWSAPSLLLQALVASALLVAHPFYRVALLGQLCFYALALAGRFTVFRGALRRVASVAYYFVAMNLAIAVGFWRYLRNSQRAAWERTARVVAR